MNLVLIGIAIVFNTIDLILTGYSDISGIHFHYHSLINLFSLCSLTALAYCYYVDKNKEVKSIKNKLVNTLQSKEEVNGLYNALIQSNPCSIGVISPSFRYLDANSNLASLANSSKADLVGKLCYDIFGTGSVCLDCPVQKAILTRSPVQSRKRLIGTDEKPIYLEITAIPSLNENNTVKHVTEIVINITDKVNAEMEKEKLFIDTVRSLTKLIDARDGDTGLHSVNVKNIAVLVAEEMNLHYKLKQDLEIAALLHDIGKVGVPEAILRKPGKLTDEERDIMRTHCKIGYEAIANIDLLNKVSDAVLYHHEFYDGTGYPHGLKGKDIPLLARVLAIADVWEALSANRPYRNAYDFNSALRVMLEKKGTHFDPEIFEYFMRAMAKVDERFSLVSRVSSAKVNQATELSVKKPV